MEEEFNNPMQLLEFVLKECSDMIYSTSMDDRFTPPMRTLTIYKNFNLERVCMAIELLDKNFLYSKTFVKSEFTIKGIDCLTVSDHDVELPEGFLDKTNLKALFLSGCDIKKLPKLPNTIEYLNVSNNELEELPELPSKLETLYCSENNIGKLPKLPKGLKMLSIFDNDRLSRYIEDYEIFDEPMDKLLHTTKLNHFIKIYNKIIE